MKRFELTIDPDYVPHWNHFDAIREILQNSIDESSLTEENSMEVIREGTKLKICTKNASLSKKSLLLGNSSKRDDDSTIGKEGEGYKLASLILTRSNFPVKIYNFSEKEVWEPKIIKSRKYKSKLLVIDVEKYFWTSPPDNDLTFEIENVTDEVYEELLIRTLQLRKVYPKVIKTEHGEVLLDESESKNIYVNGLFVSKIEGENIKYGYNFSPKNISLDRDRRTVKTFDLLWETSKIWSSIREDSLIKELIDKGNSDVKYLNNSSISVELEDIRDKVFSSFVEENGENSIPVTTQEELVESKALYSNSNPVIVNTPKYDLITSSSLYEQRKETLIRREKIDSPYEIIEKFQDKYRYFLSDEGDQELTKILSLSKNWE